MTNEIQSREADGRLSHTLHSGPFQRRAASGWRRWLTLAALAGLSFTSQRAGGQVFNLDWFVFSGGASGPGAGGVYTLEATVGQPFAEAPVVNGDFTFTSGYWALEDDPPLTDLLQTNVTWNNVVGDWSVAANWTPPINYPNNGNGGYKYDVTISGGTARLTEDITIDKLTFEYGTIAGSGNLIVNDLFTFPRGELRGPGWRSLRGGATVNYTSFDRVFRGCTISNEPGSIFALNAGVTTGEGAAFVNRGVFLQAGNLDWNLVGSSVFSNQSGGMVIKTIPDQAVFAIPFVNAGTNRVVNGTQQLAAGTTNTGNFHVNNNAVILLSGVSNIMNAGASWTGDGKLQLGAGTLVVNDGSQFSPGTLQNDGGTIFWNDVSADTVLRNVVNYGNWAGPGEVTILGNFTWASGGILPGPRPVTLRGNGTIEWTAAKTLRGRTFNIASTGVLDMQNSWSIGQGAAVQNWGTWTFPVDASIETLGEPSVISNKLGGVIHRTTSPGGFRIDAPVINEGTIRVESGTMMLNLGSTNMGLYAVSSGAVLDLRQISAWNMGASWSGDGKLLNGGTLFVNHGSTFNPAYLEDNGNIVYNGHAGLNAVMFGGQWSGPGRVTVNGPFDWPYGGIIAAGGPLILRGGGTVSGNFNKFIDGRTIINETSSTWNWAVTGGWGFQIGADTVLENKGVVNILTDIYYSGAGVISNMNGGTFLKAGSIGAANIDVPFFNEGNVAVQSGTLKLSRGGTNTGTFTTSAGTEVWFAGGTHQWDTGAKWIGDGAVQIQGYSLLQIEDAANFRPSLITQGSGTIEWNDTSVFAAQLNDVRLESGYWKGEGAVDIRGKFDWLYGVIIEPGGELYVNGGGTASGSFTKYINGRTIGNLSGSTWNWAANLNTSAGALLYNAGTVDIQAEIQLSGDGTTTFKNYPQGVLRKSGANTAIIAVPFVNEGVVSVVKDTLAFNAGFTQDVASASLTLSNDATVSATSDLVISNGYVRGSGIVNAYLRIGENATISPGTDRIAGKLTIDNNLYIAGTLEAHIGGPGSSEYDSIQTPRLDIVEANLSIRMLNGYQPDPTDEFVIAEGLSAGHNLNWFANATNGAWFHTADNNGKFRVYFGPNSTNGENRVILTNYSSLCSSEETVTTITCPGSLVVYTADPNGAEVSFGVTAQSTCGTPWVGYDHPPGSHFAIGQTTVNCSATTGVGNTAHCAFVVDVRLGVPVITDQPDSVHVSVGYPATFSVSAIGPALTYRWYRDETPVGSDSPTLTLSSTLLTDAGPYRVEIANIYGAVTSSVATLTVVSGPLTNELVVHLKFDDDYTDSSGRGNHASSVGSPTFNSGRIGQAFQFTSTDGPEVKNYATLGYPDDLKFGTTNDFTISFWVKIAPGDADYLPVLLSNRQELGPIVEGYSLRVFESAIGSDRFFRWDYFTASSTDVTFISEVAADNDRWHHVLWSVQQGLQTRTTIDGILVDTRAASPDANFDSDDSRYTVNIGQDGKGLNINRITGLMDDVGFWRRALTPEEAVAIYSAGSYGKTLAEAEVKPPYSGGGIVPITFSAGSVSMVFEGTPGYEYDVQRTDSLAAPRVWTTLITLTPGPDRSITYTDPSPPVGGAYYRIVPR